MSNFDWDPDSAPQINSTYSSGEVIYLTKKTGEPLEYCRITDFEILNTEVRAQLFSHAFGYDLKNTEFGLVNYQGAEEPAFIESQMEHSVV